MVSFACSFLGEEGVAGVVDLALGSILWVVKTTYAKAQAHFYPPPEPTWEEKISEMITSNVFNEYVDEFSTWVVNFGMYWKIRMVLMAIGMTVFWLFVKIFRFGFAKSAYYVRRNLMKMRGIKILESAVEGSVYNPYDKLPPSQVQILKAGYLSDIHLGYGVRVNDVIVTAEHVVRGKGNIIIATDKGKVYVGPNYQRSNKIDDLVYIPFTNDMFSTLGSAKARLTDIKTSILAQAYGQSGVSSGMVRKNPATLGSIIYQGSTERGMSGGGIWVNGTLVGIHHGNISGYNTSTSATMIRHDMKRLALLESSDDVTRMVPTLSFQRKEWDDDDISRYMDDHFDAIADADVDYVYESTMSEPETKKKKQVVFKPEEKVILKSENKPVVNVVPKPVVVRVPEKATRVEVVKTAVKGHVCGRSGFAKCKVPMTKEAYDSHMFEHDRIAKLVKLHKDTMESSDYQDGNPDAVDDKPGTSFLGGQSVQRKNK